MQAVAEAHAKSVFDAESADHGRTRSDAGHYHKYTCTERKNQ